EPVRSPREILAGAALFAAVPDEALAAFAARFVPERLEDGAFLFHADEPADRLYLVAEGTLEVVVDTVHGEGLLNRLSPGALVGELAVLRGEPRSASVRAKGRALVYGVGAHEFMQLVRDWPEVALAVARAVADGFVHAERRRHQTLRAPLWVLVASPRLGIDFALDLVRASARYLKASPRVALFAPEPASRSVEERGLVIGITPTAGLGAGALAEAATRETVRAALVIVVGAPDLVGPSVAASGGVVTAGARPEGVPEGVRVVELVEEGPATSARVRVGLGRHAAAGRVARLLL